jgi:hypothetical protein
MEKKTSIQFPALVDLFHIQYWMSKCNLERRGKGVIKACFQVLRKTKKISLRTMKFKTMTTHIRNGNVKYCTTKFSADPEKFQ